MNQISVSKETVISSELSALCFLEKWLTVVSYKKRSARKNRIFFPFTFNLNKWIQRDTCLTTNKIDIWDGVGDPLETVKGTNFDRDIFLELKMVATF